MIVSKSLDSITIVRFSCGDYSVCSLVGFESMYHGKLILMFWKDMLLPSSGLRKLDAH